MYACTSIRFRFQVYLTKLSFTRGCQSLNDGSEAFFLKAAADHRIVSQMTMEFFKNDHRILMQFA